MCVPLDLTLLIRRPNTSSDAAVITKICAVVFLVDKRKLGPGRLGVAHDWHWLSLSSVFHIQDK
jgi:hypothetical protein